MTKGKSQGVRLAVIAVLWGGWAFWALAAGEGMAAVPASSPTAVTDAKSATAEKPAGDAKTPPEAVRPLDEVVVTATRVETTVKDLPNSATVIPAARITSETLTSRMPDALRGQPGVMLQKTSVGWTSPYIRGFTGFRNLLLVDGIRFNNSTFRDGPNQYWSLVDPYALSRLELVKGPGAVMYGSDAVGGTVNAITREPALGEGVKPNSWERHIWTTYGTADRSFVGRGEVSGNVNNRLGYQVGYTLKDFNDLRAGHGTGLQRHTGYDEQDGDVKLEYLLTKNQKLTLAHMRASQDNLWRAHRTIYGESWEGSTVGTDLQDSFDERYELTCLKYDAVELGGAVDAVHAAVSWQNMWEDETRVKWDSKTKSYPTNEYQGYKVGTLGLSLALESESEFGRWTYGVEHYRDGVSSYKRTYNRPAGTLKSVGIQGPVADEASYGMTGLFVQDVIPLGERWELTLGARYDYARADADKVQDPVTGKKTAMRDHWDAVTGQARLMYALDDQRHWRLFGGVGQSFRAPNLSDMTRYDIARSGELETPSANLKAEHFLTYEAGVKADFNRWSGELALFRTDIQSMIVRAPTGKTVGGLKEVMKKNAGKGYIQGLELGGEFRATDDWTLFGGLTWMDGEVDGYPSTAAVKEREAVSRLMPATVNAGVRYEPLCWNRRFFIELSGTAAVRQDNLSASDRADTQRFPPNGTPGYEVFTLRAGYKITPDIRVTAAVENLMNRDYRIHGSGSNEAGRSLVIGLDAKF